MSEGPSRIGAKERGYLVPEQLERSQSDGHRKEYFY